MIVFAAALYKSTRPGLPGLFNRAVRMIEHGPYSHAEIVFSDGVCGSCSFMDGGMRLKAIELDPAKWDFIHLPPDREEACRQYFMQRACRAQGGVAAPEDQVMYDVRGNLRFLLPWERASRSRRFCNWAGWESLGLPEGWRFGPNGYALLLRTLFPQPSGDLHA